MLCAPAATIIARKMANHTMSVNGSVMGEPNTQKLTMAAGSSISTLAPSPNTKSHVATLMRSR